MKGKGGGKKWQQTDLDHGVVENRCLGFSSRGIAVLELTAHGTVTGCNCHTASENAAGLHDNCGTHPGKSTVDERWRTTATKLVGVGVNVRVASQHADVWDLDLVEQEEAIVHGVVAKLGANVSNVDVLEWLMRLQVSDLDAEWGWSIRFAVDDELGHDNRMVGSPSQGSNPPLAGGQMGRVDGEGLVVFVPSSGCFETTDVGAVAKLGLSIASDDFVIIGLCEPLFLLLRGALTFQRDLCMSLAHHQPDS